MGIQNPCVGPDYPETLGPRGGTLVSRTGCSRTALKEMYRLTVGLDFRRHSVWVVNLLLLDKRSQDEMQDKY
jgi:hypothetical protein